MEVTLLKGYPYLLVSVIILTEKCLANDYINETVNDYLQKNEKISTKMKALTKMMMLITQNHFKLTNF